MKKKISILAVACLAVTMLFSGCKKDDAKQIVGTWTVNNDLSTITVTMGETSNTINFAEVGSSIKWTFNADNTFVSTVVDSEGEQVNNATYVVKDGKVILTMAGLSDSEYEIKTLDKKNLVLEQSVVAGPATTLTHLEFAR